MEVAITSTSTMGAANSSDTKDDSYSNPKNGENRD